MLTIFVDGKISMFAVAIVGRVRDRKLRLKKIDLSNCTRLWDFVEINGVNFQSHPNTHSANGQPA